MSPKKTNPMPAGRPPVKKSELPALMMRAVSEEFSRPLNLIALNREYLQMHLDKNGAEFSREKVDHALTAIEDATLCLNRLSENFVEMCACMQSALEPHEEMIELAALVQDVCADAGEIHRALGISLAVDLQEEREYPVMGDRVFAERILLNLLSNSLRACSEGGHVVFAIEKDGRDGFRLIVEDDGCGIPPAFAPTAFQPFKLPDRTNEHFCGGAGIGLYLCGEYCRMMGWKIEMIPAEPGTRIVVRIPAVQTGGAKEVCFHSDTLKLQMEHELTRAATRRELRCVPGLEELGRDAAEEI